MSEELGIRRTGARHRPAPSMGRTRTWEDGRQAGNCQARVSRSGPSLVFVKGFWVSAEGAEQDHAAVLRPDDLSRIENGNLVSADVGQILAGKYQVRG